MAMSELVPTIRTFQDRTYNVAVVDDDKADFILISRLMEYSDRGNFRLTHIPSFDEAVSRLESESYDVALIDNYLDGKLGIDLIRRLGGRIAPCALIMLTGDGANELDFAALDAGVADYIDKNELSAQMLARSVIYAHARFDIERQFRKSQGELRRARDAAEAANIAKSEFLSRMSHQLLTPLNSIIGFAEIIGDRSLGETEWTKYTEFARDIQDSGVILLDMIHDILDISKIDVGELKLNPERLDLAPIIAETIGGFKNDCSQKGFVLSWDKPDQSIEVMADPRAVRQILRNLLSNAIKFTPPDGNISVATGKSQDTVTLVVADTGIGIAKDDLERVLIPFEPIKQAYVSPKQGAGLGLAISRSLAELQGGSLEIDSTEGVGTSVSVTIPTSSVAI